MKNDHHFKHHDSASRRRLGFTLVELLVVIAIIGILVSLLLPAVQAAREAARRMTCSNNLKQITLALHNYHDTFRSMPLSMTGADQNAGRLGSGFHSWLARILPQMEQQALHQQINFDQSLSDGMLYTSDADYLNYNIDASNDDAGPAGTLVAAYLCPSDPHSVPQLSLGATTAPGSYAANVGWPKDSVGPDGGAPLARQNGVIGLYNPSKPIAWQQPRIRFADITDGLSNTLAVGERMIAAVYTQSTLFGGSIVSETTPMAMRSFCGGSLRGRTLDRWNSYCGSVTLPDEDYSRGHGHAWISGWTFAANHFMPVLPINQRNCHIYGGESNGGNLVTPSSYHPGGAQFTMADGSVQFLNDSIDRELYWALGSRNGREVTEAF